MNKKTWKLFEPIIIGNITVKNRIYMPSMMTSYAGPNGESTARDIGWYEARAKGGTGLITIDIAGISPEGKVGSCQRGLWKDDLVPHFSDIVDAIKARGAVASVQLHHGGIMAIEEPVGPSCLGYREFFVTKPRELSTEEVEELVEKFADAALRAKSSRVDMVELHGAHGYLICQFTSPLTNMRTDKYGRDRALFSIEIVQRIKEKCGPDFTIGYRISADEFSEQGITIEYAKEVAERLEAAGVDFLSVSGTNPETEDYCEPNTYIEDEEQGDYYRFIRLASQIKKVVSIPVASGGLISDPIIAERILQEGTVDMVWLGRQLIADPEWPNKVRKGQLDAIRPCIACNDGCIGRIFENKPIWCTVNPITGFEYRWTTEEMLPRAIDVKKVLVIGAGPAGLEAARVSAIRGHQVIIVDEADRIGGTLNVASIPSFKKRLRKLIEWYGTQLTKLNVKVQLTTNATKDFIMGEQPDIVILATGAEPVTPDIPGISKAIEAEDVLLGKKEVGQNVVVIGGGLVGLDTALYLAKQGKKVTIVKRFPEVGTHLELTTQMSFLRRPGGLLDKYKITVLTKISVIEVKNEGIDTIDEVGNKKHIAADTVIYARGRKPVIDVSLMNHTKDFFVIGDAKSPRKIIDAIHEGFMTALDI